MSSGAVVEDMAYYKNIVQKLKVADLQNILAYVGKRTNGRKSELQSRVLTMIRNKNSNGMLKTKEIYNHMRSQFVPMSTPPQTIIPAPNKEVGYTVNSSFFMGFPSLANLSSVPLSNSVMDSNHMASAVHPDVKFRRLPFYDLIDVLMRPASLAATGTNQLQFASRGTVTRQQQYQFYLSPQHLKHLQNKPKQAQIQVRLCKIEPTDQDDAFPNGLVIRVNNKCITLPNFIPSNKQNVPPKRPAEPLNVTGKCLFSVSTPTKVFVTWDEEYNCPRYALGIFLVDKLDSGDLIHRLKSKAARPAEFTMGYIKEKYNSENDSEIKTLELTSSLICPLGKMRMTLPTKASTCNHLQCFDGATFIKMNELKPKWNCPVCDKPAYYDTLSIDGYFYDIVRACPKSNEIQLRPDGTWSLSADKENEAASSRATVDAHRYSPVNMSTKDAAPSKSSSTLADPDLIVLDSDSDSHDSEDPAIVSDSSLLSSKPPKKRFRPDDDDVMCLDLTEDSGDESRDRRKETSQLSTWALSEGFKIKTQGTGQLFSAFYGSSSSTGDPVTTPQDIGPESAPDSGVPKIAAGPPPEYLTLNHESGRLIAYTRPFSQSYLHTKGSPNSLSDEGPGGGEEGPPRASAGDVITLDDSLSPPPLPQQPVVTSMPSMLALEMSRNLVTSQPPELEDQTSKDSSQKTRDPIASPAKSGAESDSSSSLGLSPSTKIGFPRGDLPPSSRVRRLVSSSESSKSDTEEDEPSTPPPRPKRPVRAVRGRGRPRGSPRAEWSSSSESGSSESSASSQESSDEEFRLSDDEYED